MQKELKTQTEVAEKMGIKQATVSANLKRIHYQEIVEAIGYFEGLRY